MNESKSNATHRLQAEGRWEEASRHRDEVRHRLRTEGKSRLEANQGAWEAMIEQFPPLDPPEEEFSYPTPPEVDSDGFTAEKDDLDGLFPEEVAQLRSEVGGPIDLIRDVLWAYQHLTAPAESVGRPPGSGALGLLKWARANRDRFYEILLPKALTAKERRTERQGDEDRLPVEERRSIEEIERLIRPLMDGVERRFCEKCWRELEREGLPEGVVVVQRFPGGVSGEPGGR